MRTGTLSSPRASRAAARAPDAVGNTAKKASPCVSTSIPPWRSNAERKARRCSASAAPYFSAPNSSRRRVDPSMSVKRKVTVPRGSSPTPRVYAAVLLAPVAALLRSPVRSFAECDDADEDAPSRQHQQDDLASLLSGRLLGEKQVEERGEHGGNLPQGPGCSTTRSAKFAELLPNSHQPRTCGCTNAVLRP